MKTVYTGARIFRGGRFEEGDLAVEGSRIAPAGERRPDDRTVDLTGLVVVPGLVDVHVHLREPGFPQKETVATGTAAAARGGYTTVCSMPNLNPAPDTPETLARQMEIIRRDAAVRVKPYGTITMGQRGCGELVDFGALAPWVVGFSDDGRGVQSAELMEEAMRRAAAVGRPIVAHCEVDDLLRGGYIHDGVYCRERGHRGICSESEWRQVERDIELSARTGCQYHVCHVSTKESVRLVRQAKASGLRVSCETAPHYLLLTDADLKEEGRFKMNPPLRSKVDNAALIEAVADGTIDVIATDHAPHAAFEKEREFELAPFGITGLETSFGLVNTYLVKPGYIDHARLAELMAIRPRDILRIPQVTLEVGSPADITVVDPDLVWTVEAQDMCSKSLNSPFIGYELTGKPTDVVCKGKLTLEAGNVCV